MSFLSLAKELLNERDSQRLVSLIQEHFEFMNHNSFWHTLDNLAQENRQKYQLIAKMHLQTSQEVDGLYYLELVQKLVSAHESDSLMPTLHKHESALSTELVNILLDTAQKSIDSHGFSGTGFILLEITQTIIDYCHYNELIPYLYNQYTIYYLYANRPKEALSSIQKALEYPLPETLKERLLINQGLALYKVGRYQEAIELYQSIESQSNQWDIKNNLVLFYKEKGEFSQALTLLYELLSEVGSSDLNQRSKIYGNLANTYGVLGRRDKQREYLLCSLKSSKIARDQNYATIISNYFNLANFYTKEANFPKANFWLGIFKAKAIEFYLESDYFYHYAMLKIKLFIKQEDYQSARAILDKVVADFDSHSAGAEYLSFLGLFGMTLLAQEQPDKALETFQRSLHLATQSNHHEFIQTSLGYLGICHYLLDNAPKAQEYIEAFFEKENFLRGHIDSRLNQFYFSIDRENIYNTIIELLLHHNESLLLFDTLQRVKSNALNFNQTRQVGYSALQELMGSRSVIVDYYIKGEKAFALVILKGMEKPLIVRLDIHEDELIAIAKRYSHILPHAGFMLHQNPFLFLGVLSSKLLTPLAPYIEGREQIIISRNSHLNSLPMQIFPYGDGLLFEKIAVSYALNTAHIYHELRTPHHATLISNTHSDDSIKAKAYFDKEIKAIIPYLSRYELSQSIEDDDSKSSLFGSRSDILHIINHGAFHSRNILNQSGIYLKENAQDIFITLDELFLYRIESRFVFMSGCSTGEVHTLGGEEPLGIISYLHSCGVHSAILSSWEILAQSDTTVAVIRDFYRYWLEVGYSKSVALQRAMIDNKTVNPYEYGGYVLFGAN